MHIRSGERIEEGRMVQAHAAFCDARLTPPESKAIKEFVDGKIIIFWRDLLDYGIPYWT
jgi:hypothetical protein